MSSGRRLNLLHYAVGSIFTAPAISSSDWTMPLPYYSSTPPMQPAFDGRLPGMLARAGAFDPPAGGLLGLLQENMRNHPDDDGITA